MPRHMRGALVRRWEDALEALASEAQTGHVVLVKGSNATGLSKLVAELKKDNKEAAHVV